MTEACLGKFPHMIVTGPRWSLVNTGSGNSLVPSGIKPLPEPMLTQFFVVVWRLWVKRCCFFTSTGYKESVYREETWLIRVFGKIIDYMHMSFFSIFSHATHAVEGEQYFAKPLIVISLLNLTGALHDNVIKWGLRYLFDLRLKTPLSIQLECRWFFRCHRAHYDSP